MHRLKIVVNVFFADCGRPVPSVLRLKAASLHETMALFATHAPEGRIKPHIRPFL